MRVCRQDASHALKHDNLFKFCADAAADDKLAEEAQVVSSLSPIVECLSADHA